MTDETDSNDYDKLQALNRECHIRLCNRLITGQSILPIDKKNCTFVPTCSFLTADKI